MNIEFEILNFNYNYLNKNILLSILNKEKEIKKEDFILVNNFSGISFDLFLKSIKNKNININLNYLKLNENSVYLEEIFITEKAVFDLNFLNIDNLEEFEFEVIELNNKFRILTNIYKNNKLFYTFNKKDIYFKDTSSKLIYTSNIGYPILNIFMEKNILTKSFEEFIFLFSSIKINNLILNTYLSEDQILNILIQQNIDLKELILNEDNLKIFIKNIFKDKNIEIFEKILKNKINSVFFKINSFELNKDEFINSTYNYFNNKNLNAEKLSISFNFNKEVELNLIDIYEVMNTLNCFFFTTTFELKKKTFCLNEYNLLSILEAD